MTFTVAFINSQNAFEVSNYFNSERKAKNWAKWLRAQKFVKETKVYRGQAGGELIEAKAA